jgi:hypothetical protein
LWNGVWTLGYALFGLLLNALAEGRLGFGPLCQIALYAQTAASFVLGSSLLLGVDIPKWPAVSLLITAAYIWLAVKKIGEPAPVPPA